MSLFIGAEGVVTRIVISHEPQVASFPGVTWIGPEPRPSELAITVSEITQEPDELPDDAIVPDVTEPLPPDPDIKTDAVPEDDATTTPEDPE